MSICPDRRHLSSPLRVLPSRPALLPPHSAGPATHKDVRQHARGPPSPTCPGPDVTTPPGTRNIGMFRACGLNSAKDSQTHPLRNRMERPSLNPPAKARPGPSIRIHAQEAPASPTRPLRRPLSSPPDTRGHRAQRRHVSSLRGDKQSRHRYLPPGTTSIPWRRYGLSPQALSYGPAFPRPEQRVQRRLDKDGLAPRNNNS